MVLEEGPRADWAMRVIRPYVSEVIACDPRRNRLISRDGDKTDVLDAGKLAELYRLGSLRVVHHPERQSMMDLRGCRMAGGSSTEWPSGRSGWAS